MNFLWKSVRKTDQFDYQQHRLTGARRAVKLDSKARTPHHKAWLDGGEFNGGHKRKFQRHAA